MLLVALSAASMLAFNMAITSASVANVLVTLAIIPMLATLMARVFLGDAQLGRLLAHGIVLQPLAIALISLGSRYLPAPEFALITLLETILGPLLVWLVLAEDPGPYALAGGAITIMTLRVHSARRLARSGHRFLGTGPQRPRERDRQDALTLVLQVVRTALPAAWMTLGVLDKIRHPDFKRNDVPRVLPLAVLGDWPETGVRASHRRFGHPRGARFVFGLVVLA